MPFGLLTLNDGNKIPAIGFGTGTALLRKEAVDNVKDALQAGFTFIDTAPLYENEHSVGQAIKDLGLKRSDVYVLTKWDGGNVQEEIRKSLDKLELDYVDVYMLHHPIMIPADSSLAEVWKDFEKVKEDGLAKSLGVSHFDVALFETLMKTAKIKPAVNQIKLHPYNWADAKPVMEYCLRNEIVVQAYTSLVSLTKNTGGPVDGPVNAAAERIGATPAQVLFSWVLSKGATIVTTTKTQSRLKEYLDVFDLPPLTTEEIAAIDEADPARLLPQHAVAYTAYRPPTKV